MVVCIDVICFMFVVMNIDIFVVRYIFELYWGDVGNKVIWLIYGDDGFNDCSWYLFWFLNCCWIFDCLLIFDCFWIWCVVRLRVLNWRDIVSSFFIIVKIDGLKFVCGELYEVGSGWFL